MAKLRCSYIINTINKLQGMSNRKGIGGRKPLPDEVKELRGTLEERRARGKTPGIPIQELHKVVSVRGIRVLQSDRSKQIFKQKCNQLIGLKLLTEIDYDNISIYANNLDKLYLLMKDLKEEGDTITLYKVIHKLNGETEQIPLKCVMNPKWKIYFSLIATIDKIGSNYGFSPVSRLRFGTIKDDPDPVDPFAELKKQLTAGK
jgi:P27 family predicted phage terminase small subunit